MAGIVTLDYSASMELLFDEYLYTFVRLQADPDPDVQALAPSFQAFETEWWDTLEKEKELVQALFSADAQIDALDRELDRLSDAVAATARIEVKSNPGSALLTFLYGVQRPSEFKRPTLGSQLKEMTKWPPTLKTSSNATLQSYGVEIESVVAKADKALSLESSAEQQLDAFRMVGQRRTLVDNFNGRRKSVHGELGKIAHDKKRPNSYPESFFRRESPVREPSLEDLEHRIALAEAEVTRLKAKQAELLAAQAAGEKARADAQKAEKMAALAEAEKLAKEAADRVAELKADLGEP